MKKFALVNLVLLGAAFIPFAVWLRTSFIPSGPLPPYDPGLAPAAASPAQPLTLGIKTYLPVAINKSNPADTRPFGIAMYSAIDSSTGLPQMKAAGATRVTTILKWSVIEPVQGGGYNWSSYDGKLKNAAAAGMSIHVLFDDNPTWVSGSPRGPVPPAFMPSLENVISATVQHYSGHNGLPRVDAWSLYGEPDNVTAWGNQGAAYADMLALISPIIHTLTPGANVWLGGLAYDCFVDVPDPCASRHWVQAFLPNVLNQLNTHPGGAPAYVDDVAFNFYPISLARWPTIKEKTQAIRTVLSQSGNWQLPLIVPEMSMWSIWPGNLETQPQQAHWLVMFYIRGLSVGIRQLYWFQVFDVVPQAPGSAQGLFRGVDLSQPKQAYFAYQVLTQQLAGWSFDHEADITNGQGKVLAERYVFVSGTLQKTVVWGEQPSLPTPVDFSQTCLQRVDMLGAAAQILDGGPGDLDGSHNGSIRLNVNFEEPIYVGACG